MRYQENGLQDSKDQRLTCVLFCCATLGACEQHLTDRFPNNGITKTRLWMLRKILHVKYPTRTSYSIITSYFLHRTKAGLQLSSLPFSFFRYANSLNIYFCIFISHCLFSHLVFIDYQKWQNFYFYLLCKQIPSFHLKILPLANSTHSFFKSQLKFQLLHEMLPFFLPVPIPYFYHFPKHFVSLSVLTLSMLCFNYLFMGSLPTDCELAQRQKGTYFLSGSPAPQHSVWCM